MRKYTEAQKQQVLSEVRNTGSISIVARKNNIPTSTIHTWLHKKDNTEIDSITDTNNLKQLKKELSDKDLEIQILRDLLKKTYQVWQKN
jgi:transposase